MNEVLNHLCKIALVSVMGVIVKVVFAHTYEGGKVCVFAVHFDQKKLKL